MNKRLLSAIAIGALAFTLGACNKSSTYEGDETEGNWIKKASLSGPDRGLAVSFVINGVAYVGTGKGNVSNTNGFTSLNDFYAFTPTANANYGGWTQLASTFPGIPRYAASAFTIGSKGYVGTGYNDSTNLALNDFYEYDPSTDVWTKKANLPVLRQFAVGFAINNKGYIGTGKDNYNNPLADFYQYDPTADSWTVITSFPGEKRYGAAAFVYNNEAYVVTGTNASANLTDFYKFDGTNWTGLREITNRSTDTYDDYYTDIVRSYGAAFVIGDIAYITSGTNVKTWAYYFSNDHWERRTPYHQASARVGSVAFTIGSLGYVGLGLSGASVAGTPTSGMSAFDPTQTYDENSDY